MQREIRRVAVYCGSSSGIDPAYLQAAHDLGSLLARQDIGLVYGGGKLGLMGALADAVMAAGGEVIGIIPHHLIAMEVGHIAITSLIAVDSMHARKHQIAERADAFIALPGGIGTAEEILEVLTWLQLGIHRKPVGLLNIQNFHAPLLDFLYAMESAGFLKKAHREMLLVETQGEDLLQRFREFIPHQVDKRPNAAE